MGALHIGNNIVVPTVVKTVETPGESSRFGATFDTFIGPINNGILKPSQLAPKVDLNFTNINTLDTYSLRYRFYFNEAIRKAYFPDVTGVYSEALSHAFERCINLTEVKFDKDMSPIQERAFYNAFAYCDRLYRADFSVRAVRTPEAFGETFKGCLSLREVNFYNLERIVGDSTGTHYYDTFFRTFYGSGIETISFYKLSHISAHHAFREAFLNCGNLQHVYFPALKEVYYSYADAHWDTQFYRMLFGCTNVTVHFPSNMQSVIGSWSDVQAGFGGTNTTVLFDLEATE